MEDGLRVLIAQVLQLVDGVLILVVVEDGLRVWRLGRYETSHRRLNPCCCGRWSQRMGCIELW